MSFDTINFTVRIVSWVSETVSCPTDNIRTDIIGFVCSHFQFPWIECTTELFCADNELGFLRVKGFDADSKTGMNVCKPALLR